MNTFIYPNGQPVEITSESLVFNRFTWENCQHRVYESDSIDYVYRKLSEAAQFHGRANFVDIGAQSGLYSLYAKYFDQVYVDAFEPLPESCKCLVDNIALNGVESRVKPFEVALSNKKEVTIMRCPPDHTGLNTLGETPLRFNQWRDVQIQTDTIDNLYSNKRVDFIKCDTEGWEYFVLQGGVNVLRRDRPELLLEVNHTNMRQCGVSVEQLSSLLSELGYKQVAVMDWENVAFSARS